MKFNSTEQALIWFRDRYNAGELVLKPPFQRQPVWSEKQKHHLVESVLLELPIPELYVQHEVIEGANGGEISRYAVVDGQQRIRAVLQFIGVDQDPDEAQYNKYELTTLAAQSAFKGETFASLPKDSRENFLKYKFSVRWLEAASDEVVRDLFKRLNKYSTKLNEQELRNATYVGPFMKLSVELADDPFWIEKGLVSPSQVRRMKDVEYVSELLIGLIHGPQGGSAKSIDEFYLQYEAYEEEFPGQKSVKKRFMRTLSTIDLVLQKFESHRFATNRTDFYTLFVAMGSLLIEKELPNVEATRLGKTLHRLETNVDKALSNPNAATEVVRKYSTAVEKGVNDKGRRLDRHEAIMEIIQTHFK